MRGHLADIINNAKFLSQSDQGFWFCRGSNFWLSHRKEKSPLTHGFNYHSACDSFPTGCSIWSVVNCYRPTDRVRCLRCSSCSRPRRCQHRFRYLTICLTVRGAAARGSWARSRPLGKLYCEFSDPVWQQSFVLCRLAKSAWLDPDVLLCPVPIVVFFAPLAFRPWLIRPSPPYGFEASISRAKATRWVSVTILCCAMRIVNQLHIIHVVIHEP